MATQDGGGGLIAELEARHRNSRAPQSLQVMAVLAAVREVLAAEGLPETPTTLFAALMSSLEREETQASAEVTLAMATALAAVLPRASPAVLRSRFNGASALLARLLARHRATDAAAAKALLQCLCTVLAAYEPSAAPWPSFEGPWGAVLAALVDARPKVRKRAAWGAQEVLAALRSSCPGGGGPNPALAAASDALLRLCGEVLPAPEAAARAAAQAPGRRRAEAEDAITKAVAGALHLMGALRALLPLASPAAARGAVQLLLRLYALRQPLLSRHATDVLTALAQEQQEQQQQAAGGGGANPNSPTTTSGLDPPALAQLLSLLLKSQSDGTLWDRRSPEALVSVARLVVVCEGSLTDCCPAAAAARLPQSAAALVSLLGAEHEAARFGAAEALRELVRHAVTDDVCAARGAGSSAACAAILGAGGGGAGAPASAAERPPPIDGVVAAVASSLSARYEEAWGHALPVVSALIERIGEAADAVEREALEKQQQAAQGSNNDNNKAAAKAAAQAAKAAAAASATVKSAADPLLRALGELCAGAFDAGEEDGGDGGEEAAVAAMLGSEDDEDDDDEGDEGEEGGDKDKDGKDSDARAALRALRRRGREAERRALAAERRAQRRAARRYSASCESAMAAALRALGPEAVLSALPLNVREGVVAAAAAAGGQAQASAPEARTWMLPLLRRHVRGARLAFWAAELLPLARFLGVRAAAAAQAGQRLHALNCHTLEMQAWAALPAFCSWPRDGAEAYPPLAQALAAAARQREDLRPFVCGALERLARQTRAVVLGAGGDKAGGLFAHLELGSVGELLGGVVAKKKGDAAAGGAGGEDDGDGDDDDDRDPPSSNPDEDDGDGDGGDESDDDDDDDGPNPSNGRRSMLALDLRTCAADAAGRPAWFSSSRHAAPQVAALRQHGKDWLPLLLRAFLASEPARRGPIGSAIAALASVAEPSVTSALLQTALGRLARCARDAAAAAAAAAGGEAAAAAASAPAAGGGNEGLVLEGGSTPAERVAAHLDVCVCLSAGVPRGASGKEALAAIFAAARPMVLAAKGGGSGSGKASANNASAAGASAALLQKRGYKALAALAEARPEWLREQMPALLELLLRGGAVAATAARRQRLRLLRAVLLALLAGGVDDGGGEDGSPSATIPLPSADVLKSIVLDPATGRELVPGAAALADPSTPPSERRVLLAAALVAELVLSTKEANRRAREAAYALLVEVAAEMHAVRPPARQGAGGAAASLMMRRMMEEEEGGGEGGEDDEDDADDEDYGAAADPGSSSAADAGGLRDFVNMVCAGLAGGSPHMISATVMALARLVHAFPGDLASRGGAAPRLLPAVLTLLRSKAREVVKAVLGFATVCASRLPVDVLTPLLPTLLEGVLLWSEDSRNRFRLKVRRIVERLCRRLGVEAVAAAAPASEARLLTHIRKQAARKTRKRDALFAGGASSAGGSQADGEHDGADARSQRSGRTRASSMARTARASEWGHTRIFGNDDDDEEDGDEGEEAGGNNKGARGRGAAGGNSGGTRRGLDAPAFRARGGGGLLLREGEGGDPDDLLQPRSARLLGRAAAGGAGPRRPGAVTPGAAAVARREPFEREHGEAGGGRLIIDDRETNERERLERKRARSRRAAADGEGADYDSDDSDLAEFKGLGGMDAAVRGAARSVRFATASLAASGRGPGGAGAARSVAGGSSRGSGGRSQAGSRGQQQQKQRPRAHSGERFRATKGGAGGDVKRAGSAVEPYAYWSLDRNMLNRRRSKQRGASGGLAGVVRGAQKGAAAAAAGGGGGAGGGGQKRAQRVAAARKRGRFE